MKLTDVQVGGRYLAKVSQKLTTVRIVAIREVSPSLYSRAKTRIDAINEATGRTIILRSAQRLRCPARPQEVQP